MSVRWKSFLKTISPPPFPFPLFQCSFKKINTDGGSRFLCFNFDGKLRVAQTEIFEEFQARFRIRTDCGSVESSEEKAFREVEQSSLNNKEVRNGKRAGSRRYAEQKRHKYLKRSKNLQKLFINYIILTVYRKHLSILSFN